LDWSQWYSSTNAALCPRCRSVVYLGQNTCHNCGTWLDWNQYKKSAESTRTEPVETAKVATAVAEKPKDKSIASFISWLVAVPLVLFIIFLVFVYLSPDYDMHMVTSESMVPAIKLGDLIITGPITGRIKPGTVVTYKRGETLVTHRVISIKDGKLVTKGDAVEDPDAAPVALSQVQGVYLFKIPSLGYLANFMHTKLGWFLVVILPSILLLCLIFYEIAKEVRKMPQRRPYTESYAQRR
jgi:signal peptidase I